MVGPYLTAPLPSYVSLFSALAEHGGAQRQPGPAGEALFDLVYVRAAAGSRAYPPELSLPEGFDRGELKRWCERIENQRLRTLVSRRLRELPRDAV
jgi:hypothetical protein